MDKWLYPSKVLKNPSAGSPDILHTDAWGDDTGYTFPVEVGYEPFTLEITAKESYMEVVLNETHKYSYAGVDMKKWGIFENYFKAGNYLATTDKNAFARVKYFNLEVLH